MDSILKQSEIEQAMLSVSSHQSLWEKAMASMPKQSAIEQAMLSVSSHQSLWEKAMALMPKQSAIEQAMLSVSSHQSLWGKAMASMPKQSAIEQAMLSVSSHQSLWEKAMASMPKQSAIEQAMMLVSSHQSLWEKTMTSMSKQSTIEQALQLIKNSRNVFMGGQKCLSAMEQSLFDLELERDFTIENEEEIEDLFIEASKQLAGANDSNHFIQIFQKLPPHFQLFIIFMILQVFVPQINSISANLITPHVASFLNESSSSEREKVNYIKKIPLNIEEVETKSLRFITGNNVRLRKSPSTNSAILDEMIFGQVVTVLSKKKNWIEIEYEYADGETIMGWVFTRYTAKFKK